jgi:hypothetical protein
MHMKTASIEPGLQQQVNHPPPTKNYPNAQGAIDGEQADPHAFQVPQGQATEAKKTKYPRVKYLELPETRHTVVAVVEVIVVEDKEPPGGKPPNNNRVLAPIYQLSAARVGQWTI